MISIRYPTWRIIPKKKSFELHAEISGIGPQTFKMEEDLAKDLGIAGGCRYPTKHQMALQSIRPMDINRTS